MMAGLSSMLTPAMLGMAIGSMVGQLGARAFGQYDLPIPREQRGELLVVAATVDAFAADWSPPVDEMRLGLPPGAHRPRGAERRPRTQPCERARGPARRRIPSRPVGGHGQAGALDLGDADAMSALQRTLGDPEVLLGAVQTPEQRGSCRSSMRSCP